MITTNHRSAKVLIVDDEKANIRLLELILQQAGYDEVYSTTDSCESLLLFKEVQPDLVLLDLSMPNLDGFTVMRQMKADDPSTAVPVLVLTADATMKAKHRALAEGASDFLTKPFDEIEVLLRVKNLLEVRLNALLLEERVRERTMELQKAQLEVLQCLALASEFRDDDTGEHTKRVGATSALLASQLGLPADQVHAIRHAAPLHDVGKIGVSDAILLKAGKLTAEEFGTMKRHTDIGGRILSPEEIDALAQHTTLGAEIFRSSSSPLLRLAKEIALYHHERWNGTGYMGLVGEDIPLAARIVSVADVFDALTHRRPYKAAWAIGDAVTEIESQSGRQFDPQVVEAFRVLPHSELV